MKKENVRLQKRKEEKFLSRNSACFILLKNNF